MKSCLDSTLNSRKFLPWCGHGPFERPELPSVANRSWTSRHRPKCRWYATGAHVLARRTWRTSAPLVSSWSCSWRGLFDPEKPPRKLHTLNQFNIHKRLRRWTLGLWKRIRKGFYRSRGDLDFRPSIVWALDTIAKKKNCSHFFVNYGANGHNDSQTIHVTGKKLTSYEETLVLWLLSWLHLSKTLRKSGPLS